MVINVMKKYKLKVSELRQRVFGNDTLMILSFGNLDLLFTLRSYLLGIYTCNRGGALRRSSLHVCLLLFMIYLYVL